MKISKIVAVFAIALFFGCSNQKGQIIYRNAHRASGAKELIPAPAEEIPQEREAKVRVSFAHNQTAADNPYVFGAKAFKEKIEQISAGSLETSLFNGTMTEDENELFKKLRAGEVSIAVVSPGVLTKLVPEADIFSLPYLFDNFAHWESVLDGEFGTEIAKIALEKTGGKLRILGYWSAGVRDFYGKKPIRTPADLEGMTIRIGSSPVQQEFWKACGAIPMSIGWGELYDALSKGKVDSAENDYTNFSLKNHHKTANGKFVCETEHDFTTRLMIADGKFFDSLSEKQKNWLLQAAKYSAQVERQKTFEQASTSKAKVIADGAEIVENKDIDTESFQAIAYSIQDDYAAKNKIERFIKMARSAR